MRLCTYVPGLLARRTCSGWCRCTLAVLGQPGVARGLERRRPLATPGKTRPGADLVVGPERVVQLGEPGCGRLAAESSVSAVMVVGPEPAVERGGAFC